MKRVLIVLLIIFANMAILAQSKVQLKWSDKGKEGFFTPNANFTILGTTSNAIYVKKSVGNKLSYLVYDVSLKAAKEIQIDKAYSGLIREYMDGGCYFVNDQCFQVYAENNFKEDGTVPTYFAALDINSMQHTKKEEVGKRYPNTNYQWNFMGYYVRQSEDKTKFAFLANDREYKMLDMKNSLADYQVIVYDHTMKRIQQSKWNYTEEADRIDVESAVVDNDGNVFVLSKVISKAMKKSTGKAYQYLMVALPVSGTASHKLVNEGENYLGYFKLVASGNGKVKMGGLYSEKKGYSSSIGTFYLSYDAVEGKVEALKFAPFNNEMRSKMVKPQTKSTELDGVHFKGTEILPDGSMLVFSEHVNDPAASNATTTSQYVFYQDIIITKYNNDGAIVWQKNIPKVQRAQFINTLLPSYYSFFYTVDDDKVRILFNDEAKNLNNFDASQTLPWKGFNDATAMLVEVNIADGSYKKHSIFKATDIKLIVYPELSHEISPNKIIVFGGDITNNKIVSYRIGEMVIN